MPSARRYGSRIGVLAVCGAFLAGGAIGCSTTQEKASEAQAQAQQVLDARAKRQQQRKERKQNQKETTHE